MSTPLRKGYTTGVHATIAFAKALEGVLHTQNYCRVVTHKLDNDDLDVTKGCEITVTLSYHKADLNLNPLPHTPYTLGNLQLFAGKGVGVVTKEGLKPPKGYPAINPTPLEAIAKHFKKHYSSNKPLYGSIGVTNGEALAKQTANAKVGVMGGISILGTTGFVKPISSSAYLDSIATELAFAKANGYEKTVLTLGNSSLAWAKEHYEEGQIVEVGNFVYDALCLAQKEGFESVLFLCGIGKAVKIAQGYKNTHNRFGSIDFEALKRCIYTHLHLHIDTQTTKTVKGITTQLGEQKEAFYTLLTQKSTQKLQAWFPSLEVESMILS